MLQREVEIINKLGLHARASAKLTQVAGQFKSQRLGEPQRPPRQRQEHHGRHDAGGGQGLDARWSKPRVPTRRRRWRAVTAADRRPLRRRTSNTERMKAEGGRMSLVLLPHCGGHPSSLIPHPSSAKSLHEFHHPRHRRLRRHRHRARAPGVARQARGARTTSCRRTRCRRNPPASTRRSSSVRAELEELRASVPRDRAGGVRALSSTCT